MTLKTRIELTFLGIVATAVIIAIVSLTIATYQTLSNDEFANELNPISDIKNSRFEGDNVFGLASNNERITISAQPDNILEYDKARILLQNLDTEQDILKAHDLLIAATKSKGSSRAEAAFELGTIYRMFPTEECQKVAFVWFRKSAEWGFRKGHLELAKAYLRGLGIDVNIERSARHYRIAAKEGSAAGALELIKLIQNGTQTIPGNAKEAEATLVEFLPMLESSASNGNARAARSIGRLYLTGNLLKKDLNTAADWLSRASKFGDAAAMHDLALLRLDQNKATNPDAIISMLKKSATLGYSGSMTALGRLHLQNRFDLPIAGSISWFEQGAAAGHAGSMEELARIFLKGKLVKKDIEKARDFALRGVKLKHEGSAAILAEIDGVSELKVAIKE
ncbi:MAG: tetratricopeptide repeat protein [Lentilitoribacter sp.]